MSWFFKRAVDDMSLHAERATGKSLDPWDDAFLSELSVPVCEHDRNHGVVGVEESFLSKL